MSASSIKRKSTLHNLFTKEKGSLFNVKIWMKLLVKKSTPCYGNENRNRNLWRDFLNFPYFTGFSAH